MNYYRIFLGILLVWVVVRHQLAKEDYVLQTGDVVRPHDGRWLEVFQAKTTNWLVADCVQAWIWKANERFPREPDCIWKARRQNVRVVWHGKDLEISYFGNVRNPKEFYQTTTDEIDDDDEEYDYEEHVNMELYALHHPYGAFVKKKKD